VVWKLMLPTNKFFILAVLLKKLPQRRCGAADHPIAGNLLRGLFGI